MRTRLLLAALLALPLTACGGGGDSGALIDDGYRALSSGSSDEAMADFEAAMTQMKPEDGRYMEAKMGYLRAQAASAPEEAAKGFLELAKSSKLSFTNYSQFVSSLISAKAETPEEVKKKFDAATTVLFAGKDAEPENENWQKLIQSVGDAAAAAGDADAVDALKGLGYIGE